MLIAVFVEDICSGGHGFHAPSYLGRSHGCGMARLRLRRAACSCSRCDLHLGNDDRPADRGRLPANCSDSGQEDPGRRGPEHASFTTTELRELCRTPGVAVSVDSDAFDDIGGDALDRRTRANRAGLGGAGAARRGGRGDEPADSPEMVELGGLLRRAAGAAAEHPEGRPLFAAHPALAGPDAIEIVIGS